MISLVLSSQVLPVSAVCRVITESVPSPRDISIGFFSHFFIFFYQFWWICWALFPLFVSIGSIVLLVGPEFDGVALFSLFCLYWIHSRWSKSPLSALEQIISEKKTTSTMATSKLKRFLSSWTRYYIAAGADAFINSGTANGKSVFFSNIK